MLYVRRKGGKIEVESFESVLEKGVFSEKFYFVFTFHLNFIRVCLGADFENSLRGKLFVSELDNFFAKTY